MNRMVALGVGLCFIWTCGTAVSAEPKQALQWVVDTESEWTAARKSAEAMKLSGGFAEPTAETAKFESAIRTFEKKQKPVSITFKQSPVWDNWKQIDDITPEGLANAFVFLPVKPGDYYVLAAKARSIEYPPGLSADERRAYKKKYFKENPIPDSERGYHAWHSTDLKKWTYHGQVCKSNWVTTAEYADGEFYIYYDQPNDQDPHLIIDDDLKDGMLGREMGKVLADPSDGSDMGVFRDEDGTFHMIYENWSAVPPAARAFDSPLAGHTSSPDGIHGFAPDKHPYAIDHRTKPTGKFAKDRRGFEYEIHEPRQNVYGDYTLIKVGKQYYLFCDYEPADGHIHLGRFTSDDINKEFQWAGEIGDKFHPDPSVGFAEGKFYIVMQQKTDFVSPGPWVDGVDARVGVDVDGNGQIDQWTPWHRVKECYTQKPGFARIVDVEPARIDLQTLPEGHGFKFEFRTTQLKDTRLQPIMDRVTLKLE